MSSTSFAVREARQKSSSRQDQRPALQPAASRPTPEDAGAERAERASRDPIELMLLHGDCAFLLDLWAL